MQDLKQALKEIPISFSETVQIVTQKMKPSQILRMVTVKQIPNYFCGGKGEFCAQGAICNYLGWKPEYPHDSPRGTPQYQEMIDMLSKNGEDGYELANEIAERNNGEHSFGGSRFKAQSFKKIANWLEKKGL